ncbi:MAG: NUDIX hydrolase [Planctomycetota bacterium]|nr:MAG: NUDIX hydrolase [Planctomycetota bacterium]
MYSMPKSWTDRQIQRLLGPDVAHPLSTTQRHVAWENDQLRVECNLVRNTTTLEDQFAVRITPAADPYYGAVVVPLAPDGRVYLIGHYRYAIGRWSIELPRFDFDSSEAGWKEAAEVDLRRMTGLATARMRLLGAIQIDPALMATSTVVILAEGCVVAQPPKQRKTSRKSPGEEAPQQPNELIAGSVLVPLAELSELIERGDIVCGVSLSALSLYRASLR